MISLKDQHHMIVGGSRGIGAAIAVAASVHAGAHITITYSSRRDAAEAVRDQILSQRQDARVHLEPCEVRSEQGVQAALAAARNALGPLQGMVISAGILRLDKLSETSLETWDEVLETNLRGTFLCVREFGRMPVESTHGGSIVILTSTSGQPGGKGGNAYGVSKAGQIRLMKGFAAEFAPRGIRVNCIAPAWTETDMAHNQLAKMGRENVAAEFPLGRIGVAEDIAGPACFLLSDLSGFITGETLTVDGGMAMKG